MPTRATTRVAPTVAEYAGQLGEKGGEDIASNGQSSRPKAHFRVTNATKGTVLAESSERAAGPIRRGIGLMGRRSLPPGGGLIIQPCNGVVSFFMRFPIDVLFVDAENTVCYILRQMRPWRASKIVRSSRYVVELPAGTADATGAEVGDRIEIEQR